ncbi:protein PhnA [Marinimicrobium koreense]|uniref:Protein PhnA n=1 Tax=Marinimicrobium koreense TaxID=306545 RepID=A0A3N1NVG3_9GAMM|nr:zinc ribbon domain-containing protein YjdM [Marinimicrobium koreense]ROQ20153.1 protein PhnA [Marinimicrobium koreense]
MSQLPDCPACGSTYTYQDQHLLVCPECAHEWDAANLSPEEQDGLTVLDANGNRLQDGDRATMAKDIKVKGSSLVLKVGTKVKINRLVDGDHNIDCKVDGVGAMMLKSELVKKVQ